MHNKPRNIHNKPRHKTKTLLRTKIIIKIEKKCFFFSIHLSSDIYRTNLENRTKTLLRTNISSK